MHCVYGSFGRSINQIYFWEKGKRKTFSTGCLMDNLIYFLMLAAAPQVFKKYRRKVSCTWCSGSATALMSTVNVQFNMILAKSLWGNVDSCNRKQILLLMDDIMWYAMQVSLSISWWPLNTFLSIRFKFDSKLSQNRLPQELQVCSNSVCRTHISIRLLQVLGTCKKFSKLKYPFRFYFTPSDACSKSWKGTKFLLLPLQEKA